MSFFKRKIDILFFVDLLPARFRPRYYRRFWRRRHESNREFALQLTDFNGYDSEWYALNDTTRDALEAAITDLWRRDLYERNVNLHKLRKPFWRKRYAKRVSSYSHTLVESIDHLLRHNLLEINSKAKLFESPEESLHFALGDLLTSGLTYGVSLPIWSKEELGRAVAIDSNLSVPFRMLAGNNPGLSYSLVAEFLSLIKEKFSYSPAREVGVVLLETLLEVCLTRWKHEDKTASFPELVTTDSDYLLETQGIDNSLDQANALFYRAILLCKLRRPHRAVDVLGMAVNIDPSFTRAWIKRSVVAFQIGTEEFDLIAEDSLQLAEKNASKCIEDYSALGHHYLYHENDYAKAIQLYSQAISLDSSSSECIRERGIAYRLNEQISEALDDFSLAFSINSTDKEACIHKAEILFDNHDLDGCLEQVKNALEADPNYFYALHLRTRISAEREQFDLALKDLALLIKNDPTDQVALKKYQTIRISSFHDNCWDQADQNPWIANVSFRCGRYSGGVEEFQDVLAAGQRIPELVNQSKSLLEYINSRGLMDPENDEDNDREIEAIFNQWMELKINVLLHEPPKLSRKAHMKLTSNHLEGRWGSPDGYISRLERMLREIWSGSGFKRIYPGPPKPLVSEIKEYERWYWSCYHPLGTHGTGDTNDYLVESSHYYLTPDGGFFCCERSGWFDLNYLDHNVEVCMLVMQELVGDFSFDQTREAYIKRGTNNYLLVNQVSG